MRIRPEAICVIVILMLYPNLLFSETNNLFDNSVATIIADLNDLNNLSAKRISVFGFVSENDDNSCVGFSKFIADKVSVSFGRQKHLFGFRYSIVPRNSLDAIETEFFIRSYDKSGESLVDFDPIELLEDSDILVTGNWWKSDDNLDFTFKALKIQRGQTTELSSTSEIVSIASLPSSFQACLRSKTIIGHGSASINYQQNASSDNGLAPKEELIRRASWVAKLDALKDVSIQTGISLQILQMATMGKLSADSITIKGEKSLNNIKFGKLYIEGDRASISVLVEIPAADL